MNLSEHLHHVGVGVADLESALQWYCQKLDLTIEKRFTLEDARIEIVKLVSTGGVRIELLTSLKDDDSGGAIGRGRGISLDRAAGGGRGGATAPGATHLCFRVDDIDRTAEELQRRGVTLIQEPKVIRESNEKNCWIVDIEENMIEFIEELGGERD